MLRVEGILLIWIRSCYFLWFSFFFLNHHLYLYIKVNLNFVTMHNKQIICTQKEEGFLERAHLDHLNFLSASWRGKCPLDFERSHVYHTSPERIEDLLLLKKKMFTIFFFFFEAKMCTVLGLRLSSQIQHPPSVPFFFIRGNDPQVNH